jgi:hypothetical protein
MMPSRAALAFEGANMSDNAIELVSDANSGFLAKLTTDERARLDAVVDELNTAYVSGNLETARNLGEVIVRNFFDGDLQRFKDSHKQHVTYRALAEHEGLRPSYSSLWYAVAVHDHFLAIDEEIAKALTLSHHRRLAHVKDPNERRALAERAVRERMTADKLQEVIQGAKSAAQLDAPKRGRPAIPDIVKKLSQGRKAIAGQLSSVASGQVALATLNVKQREQVLADIKQLQRLATELLAHVESLSA